jgi:hypothetical protein
VKEVLALIEKLTWEKVDTLTATSKILPGTWVFRLKRNPDGEIVKFKGRYCVRGDKKKESLTRMLLSSLGAPFASSLSSQLPSIGTPVQLISVTLLFNQF